MPKNIEINITDIIGKTKLLPNVKNRILEKTENTFSIHWYEATWMSKHLKIRGMITRPIHRIFGVDVFQRFRK